MTVPQRTRPRLGDSTARATLWRRGCLVLTGLAIVAAAIGPSWVGASAVLLVGLLWCGVCRSRGDASSGAQRPLSTASMIRQIGSVFVVLDRTDRIVAWNEAAHAILGLPEVATCGRRLPELDLDWQRAVVEDGLARARGERSKVRLAPLSLSRPDGSRVTVGATLHPLLDEDGNVAGTVLLASDNLAESQAQSDLRCARAQLAHAGKLAALGEMSSGLAHELNQPLSAIKIGSDYLNALLHDNAPIPDDVLREVLAEISGQAHRASSIITHVRAFSRRAGNPADVDDPTRRPADLNDVVRNALALVRQQIAQDGIDLVCELDERLPPVPASPLGLEQVFVNLLLNARDALAERMRRAGHARERQARIVLRTSRHDAYACVAVADNGCGIASEHLERVFEPFFTTKEVGQGTGLGLSIAYGIVQQHAGDILLESARGEGTTFTVRLPLAADGLPGAAAASTLRGHTTCTAF